MKCKTVAALICTCSLLAVPALAHHSFAMFDQQKTITLTGTVKEFQWTNPHSWLQVMVADGRGPVREWSLEMGSPPDLVRNGWKPKVVKPGDKVSVTLHPLKNGAPGGQLLSVVLPDGRVVGGHTNAPNR
jgi:hypothetical protein